MTGFLTKFIVGFWGTLAEMSPYLLFGFLIAGLLSVVVPPALVERHLGGAGFWQVVKASLFGVPLPLCSCGVIPVAASLRRHGAGRGATTAFLLSTPQTGVDSILVTYSLLGGFIAIFRPVAAFMTGLIGGVAVNFFAPEDTGGQAAKAQCEGACCVSSAGQGRLVAALKYGFITLPQDIGKALVIGLAVAGLIAAIVPDDFLSGTLGTGIIGMLVMMAVGIPMYVCATASVPIAAALAAKGASAGAAMVFLMTGPATNAATITTIAATLGKRTATVYLATVALTSLAAGLLLDYAIGARFAGEHLHDMMSSRPGLLNSLPAVLLVGVLGWALWRSYAKPAAVPETLEPATVTLDVGGMHCSHCAAAIERALGECAGVTSAKVDFAAGKAFVTGDDPDLDKLRVKVAELGYTIGKEGETSEAPRAAGS